MDHFPQLSLLLLGLLIGSATTREDLAPLVVTGMLGGSVTLPLELLPGQQVESISWMVRSIPRAIASITVVEAGGPHTFYQAETRYWGRLSVVGPSHSLHISNLSLEDSGSYRAHIDLRSSYVTHTREYRLQVCEQLAQPRVTLSSRTVEDGHCIIILTCATESRGCTTTYSWTSLGSRTVVSQGGSVLSVSVRPGDSDLTFTCTVKNPVSNSTSHLVSVPRFCIEPGGKSVQVGDIQGSFSRRLSTPHHGYSLQISPLWLQDSGLYRAWITLRTPPVNITKEFTLRVYERLKKPNITASSQIMRDKTCFITLTCFLEQAGEDVQYSWDPPDQGAVVSHGGATLSVSWRSGDSDSYYCTAKNPVSQNSSSVSTRPLCSASFLPCSLRKEFLLLLMLGSLRIEQI
ncbi:SLAM family member 9-like isoform X2 [Castor canadensis]|uniref:SLAM family member 9-like isoform X2 n=1 Tax=Castor canadensis TaxID=51338 RepID=A0AC58KFX0_CASCN